MTYKGVYRDGIVVLQGDVDLENGARVEVNRTPRSKAGTKTQATRTKRPKGKGAKKSTIPGFGMWKDRWPASMSSADIARELRQRVSRRAP